MLKCLPLCWLWWSFYRDSYIDLTEIEFVVHIKVYILFRIGCFFLPDTSILKAHLQYLPLLEDIDSFSGYLLGGGVLAHQCRELHEATKLKDANMVGCLHLV